MFTLQNIYGKATFANCSDVHLTSSTSLALQIIAGSHLKLIIIHLRYIH